MEEILLNYLSDFITFTEDEKHQIKELLIIRSFKKGTVLLEQEQISSDSYFIIKGCLRSYYIVNGEEKTTEIFTELEAVSPVCAANGTASLYYISCVEDTALLITNPQIEQTGFEQFPQFETLCRIMSEKLTAKKQSELDNFKISNPEQRYLQLLQTRPDLLQRVPQHQLASYLGIAPQSLSRLRKRIVAR